MIKKKHLCEVKFCKKSKTGTDRLCPKHRKQKQRAEDPEAYFFNALKNNAKRRKKYFDITLAQFRDFCKRTNYINLKGKNADSASIDRIKIEEGYTISNIQILSLSDNTKKMHEEDYPF